MLFINLLRVSANDVMTRIGPQLTINCWK